MIGQDKKKEHSSCFVCNSKNLNLHSKFKHKKINFCNDCGVIFDKRVPTNQELKDYYATYSYSQRKDVPKATQLSFIKLLEEFHSYRKTNKVLDLGCGQGDFLLAARNIADWDIYGSEYSSEAIKLCSDEGIKMQQEPFNLEVFGEGIFDVVVSIEVLEHTNNPHELIGNAVGSLREGGLLYLTTPNFNSSLRFIEKEDYSLLNYPEHITFYTKNSIRNLLAQYDLEIINIVTTGFSVAKWKDFFSGKIKHEDDNLNDSGTSHYEYNESVREKMSSGLGEFIKKVVNISLDLFDLGDTLKVFCRKKS